MRLSPPRDLISSALNLFYPSSCPLCGAGDASAEHAPFCSPCWKGIRRYEGPACSICATPLAASGAAVCAGCLKTPPHFTAALSYGIYDGILAETIGWFKFRDTRRLSRPLGLLLGELDLPEVDAVTAVPLSIRGLRERGFNQSLLLARHLAADMGVQLLLDGLRKDKDILPQVGLSASERRANPRGAFRAVGRFDGKRILLVDDVMTTGATVDECSRQLLLAGARKVFVATLARAGML